MSERINLVDLREFAEGVDADATMFGGLPPTTLLALVDAVEAAHDLIDKTVVDLVEVGRREVKLSALLRRFDFGEGGA